MPAPRDALGREVLAGQWPGPTGGGAYELCPAIVCLKITYLESWLIKEVIPKLPEVRAVNYYTLSSLKHG